MRLLASVVSVSLWCWCVRPLAWAVRATAQPASPLWLSNLVIYVGLCRHGPTAVPISLIY